jgi:hypothetical protein
MDYCLGPGDGTASMWNAGFDADVDDDGVLDAVRLDLDGDGLRDDVLADLDGDGMADHAVLDFASGDGAHWFTDDGSGTWAVPVDRADAARGGALRWFSLEGVEHTGGPELDFDGDAVPDRLYDVDGDGLADRVLCGDGAGGFKVGYVDTDGDGHWDVRLVDGDGDGAADAATAL